MILGQLRRHDWPMGGGLEYIKLLFGFAHRHRRVDRKQASFSILFMTGVFRDGRGNR
jgi:hypothetical protein